MVGPHRRKREINPPACPRMSRRSERAGVFFRPWRVPEGASEEAGAGEEDARGPIRNDDDDSVVSSISSTTSATVAISANARERADRSSSSSLADDVLRHKSAVVQRRGSESSSSSSSDDRAANSSPPYLRRSEETSRVVDGRPLTASAWHGVPEHDVVVGAYRRDVCALGGYYAEFGPPRPDEPRPTNVVYPHPGSDLAAIAAASSPSPFVVNAGMTPGGVIFTLAGLPAAVIHRGATAHPELHRAVQTRIYPGSFLPAGLYDRTVEEAAEMVRRQDVAAKQMKKMRPKKFRCQHCDMAFSNNGQLKGHVRIHTGERPFKCDVESCGKSFTRNEELTRHKRIHTGVRPHSCVVCGKRFGRKDHLKKHARTHEMRDPYRVSTAALSMLALGHPAFRPSTELPPYVYQL